MNAQQFFDAVQNASTLADFEDALARYEANNSPLDWQPVGGKDNNRGVIEVSADPGRSLVERVTNSIDALIEQQHEAHMGSPICKTPREAALAWFNVPSNGLSSMTPRERQGLARRTTIRLLLGEGKESRTIEVRDLGIGIAPDEMARTILSLNESNKVQKHYLVGTYGQGGSSTFVSSKFTVISTRRAPNGPIGFTIVKYLDLPPEQFKTGRYVYLCHRGEVLEAQADSVSFPVGTAVKHFGFDLSKYPSPVGPNSLYGLLNQVLFDPPIPVFLDSRVHNYRRVIKGSRNALNGAVDEGDEATRGPELSHSMPMFHVDLGEMGRIGIEYWVIGAGKSKNPTAAFVNPRKPIVLSTNGQNQAELPVSLIRKDAGLSFVGYRVICHINCDTLTPAARRALFVSNREDARSGQVYERIGDELIQALKADEELRRLDDEARASSLHEQDQEANDAMRKEVAKLLRAYGFMVAEPVGAAKAKGGTGADKPAGQGHRRVPKPIEIHDPPTFVRIVGDPGKPIAFYPGQRRYVRIETDAPNRYHEAAKPQESKVNLEHEKTLLTNRGSTGLNAGRMRIILECAPDAKIGSVSKVKIMLVRPGMSILEDEREIEVVKVPDAKDDSKGISLPQIRFHPVGGPDDELWQQRQWPDDVEAVAYEAEVADGVLDIYYSEVFPKFERQLAVWAQKSQALVASFRMRFGIWLAAHALLVEEQKSANKTEQEEDDNAGGRDASERVRVAIMAAMFATREVEAGRAEEED